MFVYKDRYSILFKAIAAVLVCLFTANDVAWAAPSLNYNNPSKTTTLAPPLQIAQKDFQEKFVLGEFALSLEGVKDYINRQVTNEKGIFAKENEWKDHRTQIIPDIYDPSAKGRIKGKVNGLKQVVFVRLAGFLSSTGQAAFVDLTGRIGVSKEFEDLPVVYIDSMLSNTPDNCVQRHEMDEIIQWEDFRQNVLGISTNEEMADWITGHLEFSDDRLKGTDYEGMNALKIAELFHGYSYPLRDLYKYLKNTTDLGHGYIREMLQMYPHEKTEGVNIAARGSGRPRRRSDGRESKWDIFARFVDKLNGVSDDIIKKAAEIRDIKAKRTILFDAGIEEAKKVDSSYLVNAISKEFDARKILGKGAHKPIIWTDLLSYGGIGRYLICYKDEDPADGLVVKIPSTGESERYADLYSLNGTKIAMKRLGRGLAAESIVIDARKGGNPLIFNTAERGRIVSDIAIVQMKMEPLIEYLKRMGSTACRTKRTNGISTPTIS